MQYTADLIAWEGAYSDGQAPRQGFSCLRDKRCQVEAECALYPPLRFT